MAAIARLEGGAVPKKAITSLTLGCTLGSGRACSLLGDLTAKGLGVRKDAVRAVSLYRSACSVEDAYGCVRAGLVLDRGDGAAKDTTVARSMFVRACDMHDARGCFQLGADIAEGLGPPRAESSYSEACDRGLGIACRAVADFYAEAGRLDMAAAQYAAGCHADDFRSCTLLGRQLCFGLGVERDRGRCVEYLRRACDGGDATACSQVLEQLSRSNP